MYLTLSDRAEQHLATMLSAKGQNNPQRGIRVSVTDGGCGGNQYALSITNHPTDVDVCVQQGPVNLYVDRQSLPLLDGVEIDYVEGLLQSGFKFSNPNAAATCSCGKSFSAESCSSPEAVCS